MLSLSSCFHADVGRNVAGAIGERACLRILSGVHRFAKVFDHKASAAHATNDFLPAMQELDGAGFS